MWSVVLAEKQQNKKDTNYDLNALGYAASYRPAYRWSLIRVMGKFWVMHLRFQAVKNVVLTASKMVGPRTINFGKQTNKQTNKQTHTNTPTHNTHTSSNK